MAAWYEEKRREESPANAKDDVDEMEGSLFPTMDDDDYKHAQANTVGAMGPPSSEQAPTRTASEEFTFFYGKQSPFSQFHPASFTIDGVKYSCAEQYMMHQKALKFGDKKQARLIMKETNPARIKNLGRLVKGFDRTKWNDMSFEIVRRGSRAKFSQNAELKKKLLATAGTTLVEASPFDDRWGIGLCSKHPYAKKRGKWQGQNLLGQILTELRDEMLEAKKRKMEPEAAVVDDKPGEKRDAKREDMSTE